MNGGGYVRAQHVCVLDERLTFILWWVTLTKTTEVHSTENKRRQKIKYLFVMYMCVTLEREGEDTGRESDKI